MCVIKIQKLILISRLTLIVGLFLWSSILFALPNCSTSLNTANCEYAANTTVPYPFINWTNYDVTINSDVTITGIGPWGAFYANPGGANFINYGTIFANATGVEHGAGTLNSITNYGTIVGLNGYGIYLNGGGITNTITNYGTLSSPDFGILNLASTLTTLNNMQGASSSALTYGLKLPTNYNIIINSTSDFGKINFSMLSGSTTFG